MNGLLEALREQNPQLPDLLLEPVLRYLLTVREGTDGDIELKIVILIIAIRTVEHSDFSSLSMRDRLEDVPVFPSLGVNIHSIAESSGIPRETVRRKVARLVRDGWIVREGSTLRFTSKGFRETTSLREAVDRLAVEDYEIIRKEVARLPPGRFDGE
jgi:hypothetical protein